MSFAGQATSSTSNVQLIIEAALADYTKATGIDLSRTPFAAALKKSNSSKEILELLHERENDFKEYRDGQRRLISCLSPAVRVIQAFSVTLSETVSQVSHTCHPATLFTVSSSGTVPTSKRFVCWHQYSPYSCRTSLHTLFNRFPGDE